MSPIQKELTRLKSILSDLTYTNGYASAGPELFITHIRYNFLSALDQHGDNNAELYKLMLEQFRPAVDSFMQGNVDLDTEYPVALNSVDGIVLLEGVPSDFIECYKGKAKVFHRELSGVYTVVFI